MTDGGSRALDPVNLGAAAAVAVVTVAYPLAGVALAALAFWWFSRGLAPGGDGNP